MRLRFGLSVSRSAIQAVTPNPDLLAALPWTAGATTTMTDQGARMRCARLGGTCRIYKEVTGLLVGRRYRLQGSIYRETAGVGLNVRVSLTNAIGADGPYFTSHAASPSQVINALFTAAQTSYFIGFIAAITLDGNYFEVDKNFSMRLEP